MLQLADRGIAKRGVVARYRARHRFEEVRTVRAVAHHPAAWGGTSAVLWCAVSPEGRASPRFGDRPVRGRRNVGRRIDCSLIHTLGSTTACSQNGHGKRPQAPQIAALGFAFDHLIVSLTTTDRLACSIPGSPPRVSCGNWMATQSVRSANLYFVDALARTALRTPDLSRVQPYSLRGSALRQDATGGNTLLDQKTTPCSWGCPVDRAEHLGRRTPQSQVMVRVCVRLGRSARGRAMRTSQAALETSKPHRGRYKSGQLEGNCGRHVSVGGPANVKYSRSVRDRPCARGVPFAARRRG